MVNFKKTLFLFALCFISFKISAEELHRGPYLQLPTQTSIVVTWETNSITNGVLRYGDDPAQLNQKILSPAAKKHQIEIGNLNPGTKYYYSVGTDQEKLAGEDYEHFFYTFPSSLDAPINIGVLGDSGLAGGISDNVRDALDSFIGDKKVDFIATVGDNAYTCGNALQYDSAYFNQYQNTFLNHIPVFLGNGNHAFHCGQKSDVYCAGDPDCDLAHYYDITLKKDGKYDGAPSGLKGSFMVKRGKSYFFWIDAWMSELEPPSQTLSWLINSAAWLKTLPDEEKEWIVLFTHFPLHSDGSHSSFSDQGSKNLQEHVIPILRDAGLNLVVAGHSHGYERSKLLKSNDECLTDFTAENCILDHGDGSENSPYVINDPKSTLVTVVNGSSSKLSDANYNHPAMYKSGKVAGAGFINIANGKLTYYFIDQSGNIFDSFTLVKPSPQTLSISAPSEFDLAKNEIGKDGNYHIQVITNPESLPFPSSPLAKLYFQYENLPTKWFEHEGFAILNPLTAEILIPGGIEITNPVNVYAIVATYIDEKLAISNLIPLSITNTRKSH